MADVIARTPAAPKALVARSNFSRRLLSFLMVLGPGLIVMVADNDAGAVSTYTEAGARFGLSLLWLLPALLPVTYFTQEMVARLGIATGLGYTAVINKRFGPRWGAFSLYSLQLLNFLTLVTEFACISLATRMLGISPFIAVPAAAAGLLPRRCAGPRRTSCLRLHRHHALFGVYLRESDDGALHAAQRLGVAA